MSIKSFGSYNATGEDIVITLYSAANKHGAQSTFIMTIKNGYNEYNHSFMSGRETAAYMSYTKLVPATMVDGTISIRADWGYRLGPCEYRSDPKNGIWFDYYGKRNP